MDSKSIFWIPKSIKEFEGYYYPYASDPISDMNSCPTPPEISPSKEPIPESEFSGIPPLRMSLRFYVLLPSSSKDVYTIWSSVSFIIPTLYMNSPAFSGLLWAICSFWKYNHCNYHLFFKIFVFLLEFLLWFVHIFIVAHQGANSF